MEQCIEGRIEPHDIKPIIEEGTLFFPMAAELENLNKYGGDGRSFGYPCDDGCCTTITYEPMCGVLADDTVELVKEVSMLKDAIKFVYIDSICEKVTTNTKKCIEDKANLIVHARGEYLYRDEYGYFLVGTMDGYKMHPARLTPQSVEIYLETRRENQRKIKKANEMQKTIKENFKILNPSKIYTTER